MFEKRSCHVSVLTKYFHDFSQEKVNSGQVAELLPIYDI